MRRNCAFAFALLVAAAPLLSGQTAQKPTSTTTPSARTATSKTSSVAKRPAPATPMTEEQKTIYALGLSIYKSLGQFDLSPAELALVKKALSDAAANKPAVELTTYGPKIGPLQQERSARVAEKEKAASAAFLDKAAVAPGAVKTDSGLIFKDLNPGTGDSPKAADRVKVNYRGTLVDGSVFDASKEPVEFPLNGVIPCWTEGLQRMKVGGKAQLVCPSKIAYGDAGHPPVIPGGATLVFEVELLEINGSK